MAGSGLPIGNEEKVGGWGGGQAKELAGQCARVCQNHPLASHPFLGTETVSHIDNSKESSEAFPKIILLAHKTQVL